MEKVRKFLGKTSMKEFLLVKLQTFAIKIAHHRYFLKYVPKTSCLTKHFEKKNILRKKSMVDQLLNKVATLLYTALSSMKKKRSSCKTFL